MIRDYVGVVSVIIPLYNASVSIRRCIDSVLQQTYPHYDIIVVNDGSTDESVEIVESEYRSKVRLFHQANKGPAAARNLGIRSSTGKYIAFLDADDYWEPKFLEKCVMALNQFPQALAVSSGCRAIGWKGNEKIIPDFLSGSGTDVWKQKVELIDDFFDFWSRFDHIRTGSVVIDKSLLPEIIVQREDLRISEDLEYWAVLATYGKWLFLPEILFVTDGTGNAAKMGWRKKNYLRRKVCPSVESWQERIVTRLDENDWCSFKKIRGKIAGNFAYAKIMVGDIKDARDIVNGYGPEFVKHPISTLMCAGGRGEDLIWFTICKLLCWREALKDYRLLVRNLFFQL